MANIRVDVNYAIKDGSEIVFRSPVDCSAITGLVVYYAAERGVVASREFVLADAHGHNVGDIDHLFAENVVVKVILDVTAGMAYVQNADTNAYIERTFLKTVNGITLASGTAIAQNTDLDTMTTYGNYKCTSSSWAKTLEHCPVGSAFIMRVGSPAPSVPDHYYQEITTLAGVRYYRYGAPSSGKFKWYPWRQSFDTNNLIPARYGGMGANISSDRGETAHTASVQKFIDKMNEMAAQFGMINTVYKTPTGLCSKPINFNKEEADFNTAYNSYTTAYDLLRLMVAVRHTPTVYKAMGSEICYYFRNGEKYTANHSNLSTTEWKTWAANNGYTIRAIKGGSLAGDYSEFDGDPIMNYVFIIESKGNTYAVAVVGIVNNEYKTLRTLVEDLIGRVDSGVETQAIRDASGRTGMAVAKLSANGCFDDDMAALESAVYYNGHTRYVAASLAKIMTALVAFVRMGNHECSVNYDDLVGGSSPANFNAGDTTSTIDALSLILAISDNKLATMLARVCGEKIGVAVAEGGGSSGEPGADGKDGFSPIAKVTQTSTGATISITDKDGTTTATITNGKDGKDGSDGQDGYTPQKGIDYFDGQPGKDGSAGSPGADGVSPTVAVSKSGKVTTVSITDKNGTKTATINDGADGSAGSAGKDGTSVTVKSVSESTADGGSNVVTFSDGKTLTIKNGKTGGKGADGYTPQKGVDYFDGSPGKDGSDGAAGQRGTGILNTTTGIAAYTTAVGGVKPSYRILLSTLKTQANVNEVLVGDSVRYSTFLYPVIYVDSEYAYMTTRVSLQGTAGSAGKNGADGYTPVKGTDYWTEADQETIIQQVITALGTPVFGRVDADHNIILTGDLVDGNYILKYEDASGTQTEIGTIKLGAAYTNQLPISTDASGAIYNGKGWKENTRIGSTGSETTQDGIGLTGFIPCGNTATIRIKSNVAVTSDFSNQSVALYDASKTFIYRLNWASLTAGAQAIKINADGSVEYNFNAAYWSDLAGKTVAFIRLSFPGINDNAIVTINEEIV